MRFLFFQSYIPDSFFDEPIEGDTFKIMLSISQFKIHIKIFQESDNKMGMQQKLASELLNKEEIMSKMQTQIRELIKTIKLK